MVKKGGKKKPRKKKKSLKNRLIKKVENPKLKILQKYKEKSLTKKFLIPLFSSMGLHTQAVRFTHGILEKGKDFIIYEKDILKNPKITAAIVKSTSIHGSLNKKNSAREILFQIEQLFNEKYFDPLILDDVQIKHCYVITQYSINPTALENIKSTIQKNNLHNLVSFIDGPQLIKLIEDNCPELLWEKEKMLIEYLRKKNGEMNFLQCKRLFKKSNIQITLESIYVEPSMSQFSLTDYDDYGFINEKGKSTGSELKINSILSKYKNVMILGGPGSGKTSFLKHLFIEYSNKIINTDYKRYIPIFLPLHKITYSKIVEFQSSIKKDGEEYSISNRTFVLENYILNLLHEEGLRINPSLFYKKLRKGNFLFLFDGLDEISNASIYYKIIESIENISKIYPQNRFLITCRDVAYRGECDNFFKVFMMPFSPEQIITFISNWFRRDDNKINEFEAIITNHPEIGKIMGTPLLLSLMCSIREEGKSLPESKIEIYLRCIDALTWDWDYVKDVERTSFYKEAFIFTLRKIAYSMHEKGKREIFINEIRKDIQEILEKANIRPYNKVISIFESVDLFLKDCIEIGIIQRASLKSFDFIHFSFQEYLTGLELREMGDLTRVLSFMTRRGKWYKEPLKLYSALRMNIDDVINFLIYGKVIILIDENIVKINRERITSEDIGIIPLGEKIELNLEAIITFGNCLIEAKWTGEKYKQKAVNILGLALEKIHLLPKTKIFQKRYEIHHIVNCMGRIGTEQTRIIFRDYLIRCKEDNPVLKEIIMSIYKNNLENLYDDLIDFSLKIISPEISDITFNVLSSLNTKKIGEHFISILKDNNDVGLQWRAAIGLRMMRYRPAIRILYNKINSDDESVRAYSILALNEIEKEKFIPILKKLREGETNKRVLKDIDEILKKKNK